MWTTLTVIDKKERRVISAVSGGPWIFATLANDPRSIDEFIEAEIAISNFSVFKEGVQDLTLEKVEAIRKQHGLREDAPYKDVMRLVLPSYEPHSPNSRAGTRRSPDYGGTVIVDTSSRVVTVKAYLTRTMDEIPRVRKADATKRGRRIVHPNTGEAWYICWNLLSELRSGRAGFIEEIEQAHIDSNLLTPHGRHNISNPQNPTRENPEIYWVEHRNSGPLEKVAGKTLATKIKSGFMQYSVPDSWTIRDGILHINHN